MRGLTLFWLPTFLLLAVPSVAQPVDYAPADSMQASSTMTGLEAWRAGFASADEAGGKDRFGSLMKAAVQSGDPGPRMQAFYAVANLLAVPDRRNPFTKFSLFQKWTAALDKAVKADPEDPDIRFLRLTVKSESPRFLRYRDGAEDDCQVAQNALEMGSWSADEGYETFVRRIIGEITVCQ